MTPAQNLDNPYGRVREFDVSADMAIDVEADSLENLFAASAYALFALMTDITRVVPVRSWDVSILKEGDRGDWLVDWLNELIFLYEARHIFLVAFDVRITGNEIKAHVSGESIDLKRHEVRMEVKAATYHLLSVNERDNGFFARVVLDV